MRGLIPGSQRRVSHLRRTQAKRRWRCAHDAAMCPSRFEMLLCHFVDPADDSVQQFVHRVIELAEVAEYGRVDVDGAAVAPATAAAGTHVAPTAVING